MKIGNSTLSQVTFQTIRTVVTIIMFGGMTALFINVGSGAFENSLENFQNARDLLTNLAS